MLRRLAGLCILAMVGTVSSQAQITGVEMIPEVVHTGEYGDGVDLNGYITYGLYVNFTNPTDVLSSIFAINPAGETMAIPDDEDILFEFGCNLFQHELAGMTSAENNCAFWPAFPSMEYDSFITVDKCSSCDAGGGMFGAWALPLAGTITAAFEGPTNGDYFDGGTFWVDDGAYFIINDGTSGIAGPDLKVKIAQFTTCGSISGCFSVQAFINGSGANQDFEYFCLEALNPCEEFPLITTLDLLDDIDCFGETGTLIAGEGGNGVVTYEVWDADNDVFLYSQDDDPEIADLLEGCYEIVLIDALGCTDTTDVICMVEPPELTVDAVLAQDVLCFGDETGEICVDVAGGTSPYTIQLNGLVGINNDCYLDLGCGDYNLDVEDSKGCSFDTLISVNCPDEIVIDMMTTNISCDEACDGAISGTLGGGTGDLNIAMSYEGNPFGMDFTISEPLDTSFTSLCPGEYIMTVSDDNACVISDSWIITQPDTLVMDVQVSNLSCNGVCDGGIDPVITGGTGPYVQTCTDSDGNVVGLNGLCAGIYTCTVTDANGCFASGMVEIIQPEPLVYDIVVNDATCYEECNGSVFVQNLVGGSGNFTYTIGAGIFVDNQADSVGFIGLCDNTYSLQITDVDGGCFVIEPDLVINQPEELLIQVTPSHILCYGDANGEIEVLCAGGTGDINVIFAGDTVPCPTVLAPLDAGAYSVIIEDSFGCQKIGNTIILQPDTLVLTLSDTTHVVCGGECNGAIEFNVTGGVEEYIYTLNTFVVTNELDDLCAADYELCVIDANGCQSCNEFEILEPQPVQILVQETPATCTGMCDGSVLVLTVGGTGPLEISYDPEDLQVNGLCEGEYIAYVQDSVGCAAQDTITIFAAIVTDMIIEMFQSPETCWEENDGTATAGVSGGFLPISYLWSDPAAQTTATAIGLESEETYAVTITDDLGCTLDTFITIEPTIGCLFIATALTPNGDGANDLWTIGGLEYFPESKVQVFNRWGQLLFESIGYEVPWDGTYNGNRLPVADYYFLIDYSEEEEPIMGAVTLKY
jgi:gliding motility-associated-like protein